MTALTGEIGRFIADMNYEAVPRPALSVVRNGLTDCAAVMILGRSEDLVRILRKTLNAGAGDARLCFTADRAPAYHAALINGGAAHALDYDDIGLNSLQPTHPSAVLVPAVLAEGEALGRSGRDMLAAYATGYEVWGEIASREKKPYHMKGWHPTATFGAVAAAAAAARLHGLDATRAAYAIAMAASQAGGLVANFGSMTKPFHAGRAASVGVLSARLAAAGMTASPTAIEHKLGFLNALSPAGEVDLEKPVRLGTHWWLESDGLGLKLYPMCYGTHRALDGVIALAEAHDLQPEAIEAINVEATDVQLANLVNHDPKTGLDAKFCMEFAVAMAIIARRATLAEVNDAFVQRSDVRALMRKVHITTFRAADYERDQGDAGDGIIVTLKDGRRLERRFDLPLGHAKRPAPPEALWTKFADCVSGAMPEAETRRLFELLQNFDEVRSADELPLARW